MRKMHENTISCYQNPCLILVCTGVIIGRGKNFDFIWDLNGKSIVLFMILGSINVMKQTFKFMAYRYAEASELAVFMYLGTPL